MIRAKSHLTGFQAPIIVLVSLLLLSLSRPTTANSSYQVTDSFGKHQFNQIPQRIVVTDWALLEQLLALGVEPVGAPELDLYRHYVRQPTLPDNIKDIGLRRSPTLKAIKALKPDVIIIGTDQKSLARPFSHIATVMYYKSFSDKYRTNGKKSRERFLQIAELFKKRPFAEKKLAALDKEINQIKTQIHQHFNGKPPKLTLIRFSSAKKCLVYGENSIPMHTLKSLGLETPLESKRSKWGEKELTIKKLKQIEQGYIVYIKPTDNIGNLFATDRWKNLPAVQQNRILTIEPVWSYGGAMSVLYTARNLRDTLLDL